MEIEKIEGVTEEEHTEGIDELREVFSELDVDFDAIVVNNAHGMCAGECSSQEEILTLNLFSVPSELSGDFSSGEGQIEEIELEDEVYSIREPRSDSFLYKGTSPPPRYKIALDKRGQVIGLAKGKVMWIPFDFIHGRRYVKEILSNALYQLYPYWEDYDPTEANREKFIETYKEFVDKKVRELKSDIESWRNNITNKAEQYQTAIRRYSSKIKALQSGLESIENIGDRVDEVTERILTHKDVEEVRVLASGKIKITTKPIKLGDMWDIGKYYIYLGDGDIIVKRQGNPSGVCHHPHISSDGRICMGNFSQITRNYHSGEWDTVITGTIEMIRSYSSADPFNRLYSWFEKIGLETDDERKVDKIHHNKILWR